MQNLTRLLVGAAVAASIALLTPAIANAQPGGYGPPPPGGGYGPPPPSPGPHFFQRRGILIGFGGHVGGMHGDEALLACTDCSYEPYAGGGHLNIGGFLNNRLALLGEVSVVGQPLDSYGNEILFQTQLLIALQYWLTPKLWLKGGLGGSFLTVSYDDGVAAASEDLDSGGALMGAVGFDVLARDRFALDLELRLQSGSYDGIDSQINTVTVGLGFTWFNLFQPVMVGY